MTTLLIVESPAKCKKIESYLGSDYKCVASFGHLRELKALSDIVLSETEWKLKFHNNPLKQKQIKSLEVAIDKALVLLKEPNLKANWAEKRKVLLEDKIDVTSLMVRFIENYRQCFIEYQEHPEK